MEWEIVTGALALLGFGFGVWQWREPKVKQQGVLESKVDQILTCQTNHLNHHEGFLEPEIKDISRDVNYLKGRFDKEFPTRD